VTSKLTETSRVLRDIVGGRGAVYERIERCDTVDKPESRKLYVHSHLN